MILNLDCRHGLAMLPDNSVDAILTDPPYELNFMGNAWDRTGIAYDVGMWANAMRVLKPGGHMLAFSGSRTYHRMTSAIEYAGAEIRDQIMWVYGSGFPKSLDISKALDKLQGADREVIGQQYRAATGRDEGYGFSESVDITAPATLLAQIWNGWGTGLKPAHEPICVARKPLAAPTVAENVMLYGTGGINLESCRVPIDPIADASQLRTMNVSQHDGADGWGMNTTGPKEGARVLGDDGRWAANFIHDGSTEVLERFPIAAGQQGKTGTRTQGNVFSGVTEGVVGVAPRTEVSASAARFFKACEWDQSDLEAALFYYCAKASKREKGVGNTHQTVKPIALGRYLSRLICPPGGTLVDLFAGSGTFPLAATLEGFQYIAFDTDPSSCEIANRRLSGQLLAHA